MIDFRKFYKNVKGPLEEVKDLQENTLYITEDGTRIRYLGGNKDSMSFEIHTESPLVEGEIVSELSHNKGGIPLFWKLLNKNYEDTYKE